MPQQFPFSAVVGSDDMALALVLTTISPEVGGVLVRGEKGTAKSTIVRALAAVLPPIEVVAGDRFSTDPRESAPLSPDGPFEADAATETRPVRLVELPVGATEDRVLGSLHLERALSEGSTEYEPGLLARAHRGILYVDEVNLLHDHLVDLLLDAAAMGRSTVERDGVSVEHAARFVLVGTMNPEEGELRPQLLDRFGLTVEVAAPRDPALRVEVVRRRMAYDADPDAFAAAYAEPEKLLTERILAAQSLVGKVALTDAALLKIAEVCAAFEVDGMRADIVTARAAVAHAAWHDRDRGDHGRHPRRRPARAPAPSPPQPVRRPRSRRGPARPDPRRRRARTAGARPDADRRRRAPATETPTTRRRPRTGRAPSSPDDASSESEPRDHDSHDAPHEQPPPGGPQQAQRPVDDRRRRAIPTAPGCSRSAARAAVRAGKRSRAITEWGRRVGAHRPLDGTGSIDLTETLRAAAPHQVARGRAQRPAAVPRRRPAGRDPRGPRGQPDPVLRRRLRLDGRPQADGAGQDRDPVAAARRLPAPRQGRPGHLPRRPRRARAAADPLRRDRRAAARRAARRRTYAAGRGPARGRPRARASSGSATRAAVRCSCVVTDGRATAGPDAVRRSRLAADHLARRDIAALVVDCESGPFRMGLASELAAHLHAEHVPVAEVSATALTGAVHERVA